MNPHCLCFATVKRQPSQANTVNLDLLHSTVSRHKGIEYYSYIESIRNVQDCTVRVWRVSSIVSYYSFGSHLLSILYVSFLVLAIERDDSKYFICAKQSYPVLVLCRFSPIGLSRCEACLPCLRLARQRKARQSIR